MKILRISLRNIASLEGTQTVDFTRDPLRAAGLFSISGVTGSGKSTLLDALCLALYDDTPRLRVVGRLAELANGERQNDPRNLLRRGSGEGFAEVAFVGVDNATYTARWAVRRSRNRPDGSLQNTEMTLFRGDVPADTNGVIEQGGRKTEVLPVIAAKVGLSFAQFTRAVLLAQNDFATFLKADDKERAEILQALTGTERFEAISIAVFTRASAEQHAVSDIETRLAGNAPLAPEARMEADSASTSAESAWKEVSEKLAAREVHAAWFKRLAELSRQTSDAAISHSEKISTRDAAAPRKIALHQTEEASRDARPLRDAECRLRAETAAVEKSRETAAKAEEAARADRAAKKTQHEDATTAFDKAKAALETAKPNLLQARELDAKLAPLADQFAAATRDREAAEANVKQVGAARDVLRGKRDTAASERTPLIAKRDTLAPFAEFAPAAAAWLHRLDHAAACRQSLNDATAKLARCVKAETTKTNAADAERAKETAVRKAAEAAASAFVQAETSAKTHDGEKTARARSEADAARTALRDLEKHLHELDALSSQAANAEAEITKLKAANEADGRALAELREKRIPEAEKIAEAARRSFDLAEAAVTNEAVRLREKLAPGHPCPVCGATDHPHSAQPPASEAAALRALRADCAEKEKEVRALRENAAGLDATRSTRLVHETEQRKVLPGIQTQLAVIRAVRHEHPAAANILALPTVERMAALATQLAAQQQALEAADSADTARRAAEKTRDDRRTQRDTAAVSLNALEKQLAKFAGELTGLRVAREAAVSTQGTAEQATQACLAELASLFADLAESRAEWDRDAVAFRKKFADETTALLAIEKRLGELKGITREAEAALIPANEALTRAEAEQTTKRSGETIARTTCEGVRTQRAAIFAGRPADTIESELTDGHRRAVETRDLRATELDKAGNQLAATTEARKGADKTLADSTSREAAAVAALGAWLASFAARIERAFDRVELDALLARDEEWIKAERAALDAMEGAIRAAEGALAVHQKTLSGHTASRATEEDESAVAAAIATLRIACAETEQRRDAARAFLLADDQRIQGNVALSDQLTERRTQAEPWLKLNELLGSADGAKFRAIAQRRTLDILLGYANAQLDQLSVRYRLERLPESLNLIVIDRDMGDERRSVHSLSGGESFLVSLALALALASLTSNRLRIESLFIDEGFGSLDPETLNTAMNALMHLEAQGRKVGVISHVSEMTDAIPVQIRVIKGRSGASRLVVPGAPATTETLANSDADSVEEPRAGKTTATVGEIATQILGILRREQALGRTKISVRGLREEVGCGTSEFNAARDALLGQVRIDGRSLILA